MTPGRWSPIHPGSCCRVHLGSAWLIACCCLGAVPRWLGSRARLAEGRGDQVHLRPEQDLPRHRPRLLGLRAEAVRPGQAGLRVRQPGRRPVQRAGRVRRADPQEGDAGHDRRVRHARPREGAVRATALDRFNRSYEYDGLGDNYARFLLDELLPEVEKKTTSRRPADPALEGRQRPRDRRRSAAGRSAPSPRPGSGPTPSAACSAPSAPTSACAAATSTRR